MITFDLASRVHDPLADWEGGSLALEIALWRLGMRALRPRGGGAPGVSEETPDALSVRSASQISLKLFDRNREGEIGKSGSSVLVLRDGGAKAPGILKVVRPEGGGALDSQSSGFQGCA